MIDELRKLRELTETLTGNGYLRDQAEEWEYALNAIPGYIYIINPKFEIRFINDALAERLNVNRNDLYGKFCYDVILGLDKQKVKELWADNGIINNTKFFLKEIYIDFL